MNRTNNEGYTALSSTPGTGYFGYDIICVRALLQADVPINKVNHLRRNALAEVLQYSDYEVSKLLFAAGETLENAVESEIPDCLKFEDLQLQLKHICREAIRKHLLDLNLHQHLFGRIPRLGLPQLLEDYLLYGASLTGRRGSEDDDAEYMRFDECVDDFY